MNSKYFMQVVDSTGAPILCYVCGAKIVGETYIPELHRAIYHCENDHMIDGCQEDRI